MLSNQEIKFIRSLHQKKFRDESGKYIAEGIKIVEEAIRNQSENIDQVILSSGIGKQIEANSVINSVEKTVITPAEFERISALSTPSGIMAILKKPLKSRYNPSDLTLGLDQISDPGNLGTIVRLADWFGINHIICSHDSVDCYNPKVVQASMGSLFRVNLTYSKLDEEISLIKSLAEVFVYGTTLDGKNLYDTLLHKPAMIILGNEARGLSKSLESLVNCSLHIPPYNRSSEKPESLNVSVAAAIICSEFRRQLG